MLQADAEFIASLHRDADASALLIPRLPEVVVRVMANPEIDAVDMAKWLQTDPALASRLLKIANSMPHQRPSQLHDLTQAIQQLGLCATRNLLTSLVMHTIFNIELTRLHYKVKELWHHSCRVAAISQVLARTTLNLQPERALLAGLLHDIGVLPLLVYADQFPQIDTCLPRLSEMIHQLRISVGERVLRQWQVGEDLSMIPAAAEDWPRDHDGDADYGDLVQVAQWHSYSGFAVAQGLPSLIQMPAFNKLSLAKRGPFAVQELLQQAKDEINTTIRMLNV